ncbi:MAG: peptide ABC transporter substrate-binding protein, partial [Chloroflexota bacterium]|nr:peptide ABC transporter substrate-binding protein [Chloroflexota bacterium]
MRAIVAAIALTLLLAVTACSPAVSGPGTSQVLRLNLSGEPATLDPARASWAGEVAVIRQVFQGLLGFNPDLTLRAVVAQEVPSAANGGISPDGRTLLFRLRQGVRWSDGEPVTARDFEYGLKRLLDPAIGARYASFYYGIVGAREYNTAKDTDDAGKSALRDRVGVRALDDRTLEIRLTEPRYSFLHLMALWPAYPVRRDMIEKYGDRWIEPATYIGNGPFKVTEWAHQDHITLETNANYWGTRPKLDKLVLRMVKDENVAYVSYLRGELELAAVPAGNEKAVMEDGALRKEIVRYNALSTFALQFNLRIAPFDNKKLRQAIALAVDRDSFISKVRSGVGRPAYSWVPPGMPGHDPALG